MNNLSSGLHRVLMRSRDDRVSALLQLSEGVGSGLQNRFRFRARFFPRDTQTKGFEYLVEFVMKHLHLFKNELK